MAIPRFRNAYEPFVFGNTTKMIKIGIPKYKKQKCGHYFNAVGCKVCIECLKAKKLERTLRVLQNNK
jgi:hypothetical protein